MLPTTLQIKQLRKSTGTTQKQLAKAIGLSQSAITKFENNKIDLNYQTVIKIVSHLTSLLNKEKTCKEIASKKIIGLPPNNTVKQAVSLMKQHQISQIPIIAKNNNLGSITETNVLNLIDELGQKAAYKQKLAKTMQKPFPIINENSPVSEARKLLKINQAILTASDKQIIGIITQTDVI